MRFAPRTLFGRLTLSLVILLSVAQLLSAAAHFYNYKRFMLREVTQNSAGQIARLVRLIDATKPSERMRIVHALDSLPLHVVLGGTAPAGTANGTDGANTMASLLRENLGAGFQLTATLLHSGMRPSQPQAAGAQAAYDVEVHLHDGQSVQFIYRLPAELFAWRWRLVISLSLLLLSTMFVAWLSVRWLVRPLALLAHAADDLGKAIPRPPLSESGPEEIATAARAFNRMQQRLARFIGDRARVLAAVSHDLKTPITRLRLRAAMLDDEILQHKIQGDLDEMSAMVSDTLEFLRDMEGGEPMRRMDVVALIESIQSDTEDMGESFTFDAKPIPPFHGRPLALKRCIGNLVQNALSYGERVTVRLNDHPESLQIIIDDRGPGIPEALQAQVFEPFFRIEGSRNRATGGTGLGLAIARNIARGHGGDIVLANRTEGGLRVTVTLPR